MPVVSTLCYFLLMSNSLITDCCLLLLFAFISFCYLLRLATLYGLLVTASPFVNVRFYLLVHLFSTSCYSPLPLMPSSVRGKVRQPRVAGRTQLLAKLPHGETIEDAHIPQVSSHTRPQGTGALSLPVCVYLSYCVSILSVSVVTLLVSVFLYVCLCVCVKIFHCIVLFVYFVLLHWVLFLFFFYIVRLEFLVLVTLF